MNLNTVLTIAGLAALACLPVAADVIYDNGAPDYEFAYRSSDVMATVDDFYLPDDAILGDVHWWGIYSSAAPLTETFQITIYTDSAGMPGSAVQQYTGVSATRAADITIGTFEVYSYSADLTPLNLLGDTTYWISIYNEDTPWFWVTSNGYEGNSWQYDSGMWFENGVELAFNLTSPGAIVPEPMSMTLLGLGIAAVGLRGARWWTCAR